ncbi:hypothetical protein OSB04_012858 [Centaurea solstitialis]|uniref:Uncharacterized protein n=1 Tax=Centaurea solstitialis TaxID=347529 RepID=A0AA38WQA1_9ASTR|nr:hypothetical protein OSB04_012858 [Centaurea solstitialis]
MVSMCSRKDMKLLWLNLISPNGFLEICSDSILMQSESHVRSILAENGTHHRLSCPYTPDAEFKSKDALAYDDCGYKLGLGQPSPNT